MPSQSRITFRSAGFLAFLTPNSVRQFSRYHPKRGRQMRPWWTKSAISEDFVAIYRKRLCIWPSSLLATNRKSRRGRGHQFRWPCNDRDALLTVHCTLTGARCENVNCRQQNDDLDFNYVKLNSCVNSHESVAVTWQLNVWNQHSFSFVGGKCSVSAKTLTRLLSMPL